MHHAQALPFIIFSLILLALPAHTRERAWIEEKESDGYSNDHHVSTAQKFTTKQPVILRKMSSDDPGQMLFLSDWQLDSDLESEGNVTGTALELPFLPHGASHPPARGLNRFLFARAGSGFSCPSGTNSCASIGADYGCCPQGTTCQLGSNGNLGCCPGSAGTCAGNTPTNCEAGYSSCSLFHGGGGCCASGFQCQSQGCVGVSTTVVVVYPTVTVTRTSSSSSIVIITSTSSTLPTSTSTRTVIVSSSTSTSSSSSTPVSTTIIVSTSTPTPTSVVSASTTPVIPIAPTSISLTTSTVSQPTTIFLDACPTGYYACSAVYNLGACCQVGRDCSRTSCPAITSSTALVSNGVTIADVSATGVCATGWSTCGSDVGGGCCPSGYSCGTQLCSATGTASAEASVGSVIAKEGSSSAMTLTRSGLLLCIVLVFWLGSFLA